ncbi:VLRF1 family aeRF1-type release factor [Oceanobacillus jeddahense]|uniref:VLRF1 family aeRF1-type release factor n=1 Tax=Oceanobacillus jeddahense TaxID=1462527 RepID=A0ABY5JSR7_9BACI|nr:VLRF1 family aeRF1-type release factor [Oceanobacillus jeddahense]UUI03166.1 VLRF1 family aeRF1-type release factor [Oceanobacillus jeddahense]
MLLQNRIKKLKQISYEDPKKVLSVYLNTDHRDPEQQGGAWKIELKNGLNELADATQGSNSHEEKNQSQTIRQKVEKEVYSREEEKDLFRGFVLFGTADEDLWFSQALHIPVKTEFHWENKLVLEQLKTLEKDYPYTGIIVIQQDEVIVLETELGTLLDQTHYTLDMNTDDWRQHQGPQGNDITQGGAKRDEYKERVKEHQQRWFKALVTKLEKRAGQRGWEQIYLVGEKNEVEPLKSYFNKNIDKTVPRNLLNSDADKILADVLED